MSTTPVSDNILNGLASDGAIPNDLARQAHAADPADRFQVLIDGGADRAEILKSVASEFGVPYASLVTQRNIDQKAVAAIPGGDCIRLNALGYRFDDNNSVVVAMANPNDRAARNDIEVAVGGVGVVYEFEDASIIRQAIDQYHSYADTTDEYQVGNIGADSSGDDFIDIGDTSDPSKVVKHLAEIVRTAVRRDVSDIHFSPQEDSVLVNYRVNGVIQNVEALPRHEYVEISTRIMLAAGLDIAEHQKLQDGRAAARIAGTKVDFRVAVTPGVNGKLITLRVLADNSRIGVQELGFTKRNLDLVEQAMTSKQGIILVTGATSSGKSTTLYAFIRQIAKPGDKNIITMEDPVEQRVPTINQIQVNAKQGRDFSDILRGAMRSDPDIIFVGEIRDTETAKQAARAAETGHLVLSTLHTNSAAATATRFIDMGVEPYRAASTIRCIISQTLIPKLCTNCRISLPLEEIRPYAKSIKSHGLRLRRDATFYVRGEGCFACKQTATEGRIACHEVLVMSEELSVAITEKQITSKVEEIARQSGMRTLVEDAWDKAQAGIISVKDALNARG